jgi:hypothetical protein
VLTETIDKAATTTTVTSSVNPAVFGQAVTLTATVSAKAPDGGTPTGTVTFYSGNANPGLVLGTGTLDNGTATLKTSQLPVGTNAIDVDYAGSTMYGKSAGGFLETVKPAATTTTVTSSVNPAVFGQAVTLTATVAVTQPGRGVPTGTVTFYNGTQKLGTGTLNPQGVATLTTTALPVAKDALTATYQGTIDCLTSTSAAVNETVTVHVVVLHPTHLTVSPSQMVPVRVELLNYNGQPMSDVTATLWVNGNAAQPMHRRNQGNTFKNRRGVYEYWLKLPLQEIAGSTITLTIQVNGVTALLPNGSPQILTLSLKDREHHDRHEHREHPHHAAQTDGASSH